MLPLMLDVERSMATSIINAITSTTTGATTLINSISATCQKYKNGTRGTQKNSSAT
jgi:hypothetical protein